MSQWAISKMHTLLEPREEMRRVGTTLRALLFSAGFSFFSSYVLYDNHEKTLRPTIATSFTCVDHKDSNYTTMESQSS